MVSSLKKFKFSVINKTNIPDWKIAKIIEFCRPKSKILVDSVYIKNSKCNVAGAYYDWSNPYNVKIVVYVGCAEYFPVTIKRNIRSKKKGYYSDSHHPLVLKNRTECIIYGLSHEMKHGSDANIKKFRKLLVKHHPESERRAERTAMRKLQKYRSKIKYAK